MIVRISAGLFVVVLCVIVFLWSPTISYDLPLDSNSALSIDSSHGTPNRPTELIFVGDLMLGRTVETVMEKQGINFPFQNIRSFVEDPDLMIGNFEGIVSRIHEHAPSMTFRFSIKNEYLTQLTLLGFDVLSLANNHSFDYGQDALSYTRDLCRALKVLCGGTPNGINAHSTAVREVNGERIGFIFLHTVHASLDETKVVNALNELQSTSDLQIAYVHWGDEYALVHNTDQEKLARLLIDTGADVVIGHHPHVVQDIALYKEKPIFYSLGNFIFDQNFIPDVEDELAVKMTLTQEKITYTLIPFTTAVTHVQPDFMNVADSDKLLNRILANVATSPEVDVQNGTISLSRK